MLLPPVVVGILVVCACGLTAMVLFSRPELCIAILVAFAAFLTTKETVSLLFHYLVSTSICHALYDRGACDAAIDQEGS